MLTGFERVHLLGAARAWGAKCRRREWQIGSIFNFFWTPWESEKSAFQKEINAIVKLLAYKRGVLICTPRPGLGCSDIGKVTRGFSIFLISTISATNGNNGGI